MSEYTVNNYINKKFMDIYQKEPTVQAYNLGIAVGILEVYKEYKKELGEEAANKCFKNILDGTEEFNVTFRTMVGLYNKETNSKTQKLIEIIQAHKDNRKPCVMTNEDRDMLEELLEFAYRKTEANNESNI